MTRLILLIIAELVFAISWYLVDSGYIILKW